MLGPSHHHREFDADDLAQRKRAGGHTLSVCLPARNEAGTVGAIVAAIDARLRRQVGLVDEIVVVDDGSTDDTAGVATRAGARVVAADAVLPEAGPGSGKGDVLWKSLSVTRGDLVCWLDADLADFSPHFVTGLVGPLLTCSATGFVKAFYDRPLQESTVDGDTGGRVTELVARPLISMFFPHLAEIRQPLGGEYAGRRELLERVPFVEGWGVELGLLVDLVRRFGPRCVAQVDLEVRRHRNRPLDELAPQAMAIIATALRRAGVDHDAWGDDLLRVAAGGRVERASVEVRERPPMTTVPAYQRLGEQTA